MKLSVPLLHGLTLCILLVSAPHADHLPLWVSALSLMLLAWRSYLTWSGQPLPARWLLLGITMASVSAIGIGFHTLFGRDVGVTLLILLAALKLLELRAVRDATLLVYLSCFIIITNFFYSQSIPTAGFMLLSLLAILTTWLQMQTGTLDFKPRLRLAGTLLLQAIPLSLALFVLFPRVQGPLWGMPQDAYASSGLSERMAPGSMSKLSLSEAVAFRVSFDATPPLREQMYWRGPVLWDYDGTLWTRGVNATLQAPKLEQGTLSVGYTVTLEPHNKRWLFALEMANSLAIPSFATPDMQLLSQEPVTKRLRYHASSNFSYRYNVDEAPAQLRRAKLLPPGFNPRARQLAAQWRSQYRNDAELVQAALRHFNQNGFGYTLEPPPIGVHGVDDFLFETRQGFCEYYASAFVFLMRAAGVPARVVTGYQGAEYNELGDYYIVRQSDAHAWAEVWLAGQGWVRADPTAAIAPSRIQNGLATALPDSTALPFMARNPPQWLRGLRFNWDNLTNQWNQWVLGYDTERQFAFLTRLGMEDVTWQKLALNLLAAVTLLVGLYLLILLRRLRGKPQDKVQVLWLHLCRKLAKAGFPRAPHEGARDYARRIAQSRPDRADAIYDLAVRYMALRYGNSQDTAALDSFKAAVRRFTL